MINRDLSDLPRSVTRPGSPKRDSVELANIITAWRTNYEAGWDMSLPMAIPDAGPYRASYANTRCDRALHYRFTSTVKSNPVDVASLWNFWLGHLIGEGMHAACAAAYPSAIAEQAVDLRPLGIPGSGSSDTWVPDDGEGGSFNLEYKSTGGYGFKKKTVEGEGPTFGSIVQGALSNRGLNADRLLVPFLSKENISVKVAAQHNLAEIDRFAAVWEYSAAECDVLVRAEAARVGRVLQFADTDILPARELSEPRYPVGAVIKDPKRGTWVKLDANGNVTGSGTAWECDYCDFRDQCITDGAGGTESTGGF